MLELYEERVKEKGNRKANIRLTLDVILLFRPGIIRSFKIYHSLNHRAMLRHNLILTFRSFKRYKSTFFINLIGLSSGLACALLIYLWVNDELSIDKFHEKDSQLFQVMEHKQQANDIWTDPSTSGLMAESLAEEMSEVEYATSTGDPIEDITLSVDENNIRTNGQYVGRDFFNVFSYHLIQGDENQVLADKNSIVVSEDLAMKLFNTAENIIGKSVEFQYEKQFLISGIFKTVPPNSSEQFDFVLSFELFKDKYPSVLEWYNESASAYFILKPGTDINQFNNKIANYIEIKTNNEVTHRTPFLKRYSEKYLYNHYENGVQAGGRIEYVRLFSIIAIFILVIACINFMNLSTAKASRRLKEVGIKKAIGAGRKTLIFQYFGESMLMTFLSLLLSILLVVLFLPQFNQITGKQLTIDFDVTLILSVLGITLLTGLIAGSYPALYLSGFNPITVLKGKLNNSVGEIWARKGLVVFQFAISVMLIVSVLVVYEQIEYVQSRNLGYDKENIIWFKREGKLSEENHLETFLSEIRNIPGIVSASSIGHSMTGHNWGVHGFEWEGKDPNDNTTFENVAVDFEMMETLGIAMKEGRTFSRDFSSENTKIIFNEAAIKHMGLKDPIGKIFTFWGDDKQIIGVAKDFHFESLHENIKPLMFTLWPECTNRFMAKLETGREKETLNRLQEFYQVYSLGFPLDYQFLDENYQALYAAEQRVSTLSRYFAGIAILISCLGLFGLAAFTAERRLKEIGIRKILGASDFGIVRLLSGDFTKMVLVAIVIALPISYFIAQRWLEDFAFSIDLEWWYFAGAGLLALLIAWFTVGLQTVKAARINPVECLKDE